MNEAEIVVGAVARAARGSRARGSSVRQVT